MSINTADEEHAINTVKGGQLVGSGTVSVHPSGEGAHFEVIGKDAAGRSVRATFQCARSPNTLPRAAEPRAKVVEEIDLDDLLEPHPTPQPNRPRRHSGSR